MIYKLGNSKDLDIIPNLDSTTRDILYEFTNVLSIEYGEDRDIDNDDGGYVLYVTPGTPCETIKDYFDYSKNTVEYVNRNPPLCSAVYLTNNEYAIVIVMSIDDAPEEFIDAFEEGY